MPRIRVDMFGTSPGKGSALDVLLPDPEHPWTEPDAAAHARGSDANETALVTSYTKQTFATRIFNTDGETPFGTHSMAGVAACLVTDGRLAPGSGEVARTTPDGSQWLWTDGHQVCVPFNGPAIYEEGYVEPELIAPYAATAQAAGVGRRFTLVHTDDDPLRFPAPDFKLMQESGTTDLTLFTWDPERRQALARVFAPGFGFPEDAGCLPAASAVGIATLSLDPTSHDAPIAVKQVTTRGTESVFTCMGSIDNGTADLKVKGQVWAQG